MNILVLIVQDHKNSIIWENKFPVFISGSDFTTSYPEQIDPAILVNL